MISNLKKLPMASLSMIGFSLLFSGCFSQEAFIQAIKGAPKSAEVASSPAPVAGTQTATAVVFRNLQPALAIRGADCLMCHAQIASNMITDFGAGDSFFFDKDKGQRGFYAESFDGWHSGVVRGTVFVPKVDMDHTFDLVNAVDARNKLEKMSLAQVIQSPRQNSDGSVSESSITTGVSPKVGDVAVVEKSHIYIGAPTEEEILALAPEITQSGFKMIKVNGINPNPKLPLSGLQVVNGPAGSYVSNLPSQEFVCAGDVFIRGTLYLNAPVIRTDNQGCRLYVSGSVFLQGAVKYAGENLSSANLQITSSRMIGMGFSQESLQTRFCLGGSRSGLDYLYVTRSKESPGNRHRLITKEAMAITGMLDAGPDNSPAITDNPINGVLLNAPEVHGRYTGNFKGAVVAEIGMFRLGHFEFSFDPIFQKVPILPALKSDILSIKD